MEDPIEADVTALAQVSQRPAAGGSDQVMQLSAIFADGPLRSRAAFATKFAGQRVHWSGVVRRAHPFQTDVHFGREPGVRATIAIGEIDVPGFGELLIDAVVRLPVGTQLPGGHDVSFHGTLHQLDGLTRDIYIADATLTNPSPEHDEAAGSTP